MSDYRVTVTVPVEQAATASAVGRAMDIDVGGEHSFVPVYAEYDEQGKPIGQPTSLQAKTWASEAFATMFQYLISNPTGLYMAVVSDYETRGSDLLAPTMQDIDAFCATAKLTTEPALGGST